MSEVVITVDNLEEVNEIMAQFPIELHESVYRRFQRVANREEKELKGTTGFKDVTGHLRRGLFAVAKWRPLGIDFGTYVKYAKWVAFGHGTWKGNWWLTYLEGLLTRLPTDIASAVTRAVKDFNIKYGRG